MSQRKRAALPAAHPIIATVQAVRTPLGFVVLVTILLFNLLSGFVGSQLSGSERLYVALGTSAIIFAIMAYVIVVAMFLGQSGGGSGASLTPPSLLAADEPLVRNLQRDVAQQSACAAQTHAAFHALFPRPPAGIEPKEWTYITGLLRDQQHYTSAVEQHAADLLRVVNLERGGQRPRGRR